MSIPVAVADLAEAAAPFGAAAFLLTAGDDGRPRIAHLRVTFADGGVVVDAGRGARANATARPLVTLLFPPYEPDGYSLIVDADATVRADDVLLVPTGAVLHRPAT
jgi:hypothetical protein